MVSFRRFRYPWKPHCIATLPDLLLVTRLFLLLHHLSRLLLVYSRNFFCNVCLCRLLLLSLFLSLFYHPHGLARCLGCRYAFGFFIRFDWNKSLIITSTSFFTFDWNCLFLFRRGTKEVLWIDDLLLLLFWFGSTLRSYCNTTLI